jgi:hypothetical protein
MDWQAKFSQGLAYDEFLARYGQPSYAPRWQTVHDRLRLADAQKSLLGSFRRTMNVLCLAGAWCGDCINQCPIFDHFARSAPVIKLRFLDRDDHADVQRELSINAGKRVPVVVFLSEDNHEVARYGERTLAQYRQLAHDNLGPACPTGLVPASAALLDAVTQEWLDQFERAQLILRLSPRLRQMHGD